MINPLRHVAIDLSADIGEGSTRARRAVDDALMKHVTSVNIACGGHAGDEASMRHAVQVASGRNVAVGAHPSYPDRANFGRLAPNLDPSTLRATVAQQLGVLNEIAESEGVKVAHCKPHGALYHAASEDEPAAWAIYEACKDLNPSLHLVSQAGSRAASRWRAWGAPVIAEAFVDRVYESDGSLRSREHPDALIADPEAAAGQATRIATTGTVCCATGSAIPLRAETLCVHSDTPNAVDIARCVSESLKSRGMSVRPFL